LVSRSNAAFDFFSPGLAINLLSICFR